MEDSEERAALRLFYEALEAVRPEVDAATEAAMVKVPAIAAMTPEQRQAQRTRRSGVFRRVLLEGEWEPYLADLRRQGAEFARSGMDFRDWFSLLGSYRGAVRARVLPDASPEALLALRGMDRFTDSGLSELTVAFIDAKEQLARAAEVEMHRFSDLFQHAPVGMVIWHLDEPGEAGSFRLVMVNAAAIRLSGVNMQDDVGRRVRELPAERRPRHPDLLLAAMADGEPRTWSASRGADPATRRDLDVRCFALPDGYLGVIFEEVTEKRRMAERIEHHVRELERSNRELDDFAYVTSHDLKSPLRDVRNLVSWITEDVGAALPAASARHLALVEDRVQRMEQLLDDLLEYSRVGRMVDEPRAFTLREALDEVLALQPPRAGFVVAMEGDDVAFTTPRTPFEKVLRNLVGNAIKHHDRATGRVTVSAAVHGGRAEVRVADDGPGIAPEFHERVFRMFQTLKPRDVVEGSGVGLAIVKKTVEVFGGTARVESGGRGAAVVFTWPLRWGPTEAAKP